MPIPGNLLSATTEMVDPNTSGWTPRLNCQPLTKGVGGRNGDGCLVTKSVAAGEVQARTVSSYPVVAGTTYEVFADSAGVVPERIGIRWINASGGDAGFTWSLTTLAAASGWHRVSVAGVAPVGAVQAQVFLSSTETGAGVSHYWENVYLGLPIRTQGNLFGFNTESSEVDASQWTPLVNATISRQVPVLGWAVDNYTAGGHCLAMTAVAAGNAAILAINGPSVTPGVEYLAYAYLSPPTLSSTAWIELRFYDVNGNQIQNTRSTLAPPGTGMYRQRASAKAPANAASCSIALGLDGASAGQVLRAETIVVTAAPVLQAGSVVPYADASFEQGVAGWTTVSGVAALARSAPWATGIDGNYTLTVTSASATASTLRSAKFPLGTGAGGQNWRAWIAAQSTAGTWSTVRVQIRYYNAANADLGASGQTWTIPAGWVGLPADATAPATATQAAIELIVTASSTAAVLQVDSVMLYPVLPLTTVEAVDGGGYIVLTLRELSLDYLISVYREMPDGSRILVRGPSGLIDREQVTSDLMVIEDHEAPLNVPVRYFVELIQPNGVVATRASDYATVTLADANIAWLKDPGNPQRNMQVMVEKAPDWQRPIDQSAFVVRGRRNKVILSGNRQGLEGDLAIWTRTDEERKALHLLLDSGNVLLWQAVPGMGVDDMYVNVGAITEARVGQLAQEVWRAWTLPLIESDRPVTAGINGAAGRTWQDVVAEFDTNADLLPVYATSEALLLDRRTG
ncbi:hypothetical protein [Streptomyces sp. KL116D]|uniref:hypothetical protein n=1 Tax=Streptomyces sp. KL116D TaxID=3045152 RepID=UPI003558D77B